MLAAVAIGTVVPAFIQAIPTGLRTNLLAGGKARASRYTVKKH